MIRVFRGGGLRGLEGGGGCTPLFAMVVFVGDCFVGPFVVWRVFPGSFGVGLVLFCY